MSLAAHSVMLVARLFLLVVSTVMLVVYTVMLVADTVMFVATLGHRSPLVSRPTTKLLVQQNIGVEKAGQA